MLFLRPIAVTAANLTTNVADTVAAYNAGTTYTYGQQALGTDNHVYISAANGNVGRALTDRAWWVDSGMSNKLKMFDMLNGSQTTNTTAINTAIVIDGWCDSVALLNLTGDTVTIKAVATGGASRRNGALRSRELDNASWSKTNVTVTANSIAGPDGTLTADKVAATASAATTLSQTIAAAATGAHVCSFYVKQGSGTADANKFRFRNNTTAVDLAVLSVNYAAGVVTQTTGAGATMTAFGELGWWRIEIPVPAGITNGDSLIIYPCFTGSAETAAEYAYVTDAQLETGSAATDPIATAGAAVTTTDFNAAYRTYSLRETATITDWWQFFFEEISFRENLAVTDIPPYIDVTLSVNVAGAVGATVGCGTCIPALSKKIGDATYGTQFGIASNSLKIKDEWGNFTILPRPYSDTLRVPIVMDNGEIDAFKRLLRQYRDTPLVFVASTVWDATMAYGFAKDLNVDIAYSVQSSCTLEIEGLT